MVSSGYSSFLHQKTDFIIISLPWWPWLFLRRTIYNLSTQYVLYSIDLVLCSIYFSLWLIPYIFSNDSALPTSSSNKPLDPVAWVVNRVHVMKQVSPRVVRHLTTPLNKYYSPQLSNPETKALDIPASAATCGEKTKMNQPLVPLIRSAWVRASEIDSDLWCLCLPGS